MTNTADLRICSSPKPNTVIKMPRIPSEKTVVVVPCYNEELRFPKQSYLDFVRQVSGFKFLFVDDGSTDNTFQILSDIKAKEPNRFEILKLERNSGKAEAVRQGFVSGMNDFSIEFLAFWDADLATPLKLLLDFMTVFQERSEIEMVIGARVKLMGRNINRHAYRHYLGRIFATFASLVLNLSIYDTQCGAKVFRVTPMLKKIFNRPFKSKWIFDVEILARYMKEKQITSSETGNLIYELPLSEWQDVAGSKLRLKDYLTACLELIQIYFTYR